MTTTTMDHSIRDKVAIVGVGTTDFGALYRDRGTERSAYDLGAWAFREALADAGLDKSSVDGIITSRLPSYPRVADMLGLRHLRVVNAIEGTGRMSGIAVQMAVDAIVTGRAETVALVYGNNGRSAGAKYGGDEGPSPTAGYDMAYGMTSPGAYVSMMYQRYQAEFGVPDGALAPLAINNRDNAMLNPIAVMQKPLTEEEYRASRYIAEPLRLFDYCIINDGAVAMILTSAERAKDLKQTPVNIVASTACADLTNFYTSDDYFYEASQRASRELYAAAGLGPEDVDVLEIYDNFTPTILFSLEGFDHCGRGESWEWIKNGQISLTGKRPVNTSGGHTSESYMQGWALHVEAVRQLRGECGDRQVPGCEVAQYICASPVVTSHILRRG
jgi:acetyl-CoA acetyltransferase